MDKRRALLARPVWSQRRGSAQIKRRETMAYSCAIALSSSQLGRSSLARVTGRIARIEGSREVERGVVARREPGEERQETRRDRARVRDGRSARGGSRQPAIAALL